MRLIPDSWGTRRLQEFNHCNLPKGERGGQFGRKDDPRCAGGGAPSSDKGAPRDRLPDEGRRTYILSQMKQLAYTIIRMTGKSEDPGVIDSRLRELDKKGYAYFKQRYATVLGFTGSSQLQGAFPSLTRDEANMIMSDVRLLKLHQGTLDSGEGAYSDPEPAKDEPEVTSKTGAQVREDVLRIADELEAAIETAQSAHWQAEREFTAVSKSMEDIRREMSNVGMYYPPMYFIGNTIKGRTEPSDDGKALDRWLNSPDLSQETRDARASKLLFYEEQGEKLQQLSVAMYKAAEDLKAARDAKRADLQAALFLPEDKRLANPPRFEVMTDVYGSKTVYRNQQKALEEARAFFAGVVGQKVHGVTYPKVMNIQKAKGRLASRAFASAWSTSIGINKFTSKSVLVHELAHHLEFGNDQVLQAAVDFRDTRVKGETELVKLMTLQPGHGYGRDEVVRKGSDTAFRSIYAGKVYAGNGGRNEKTAFDYQGHPHNATEVLTMGMQYLYEDAAAFAREDPDWFDWTVDMARHGPTFAMRNLKAHLPKTPEHRATLRYRW